MTDRELLELAAKSAGLWKESFSLGDDWMPIWDQDQGFYLAWGRGWWNPLSDDDGALRLAVTLNLEIAVSEIGTSVKLPKMIGEMVGVIELIDEDMDKYEATRRAIVRAAAEIGKGMP